MSMLAVILEWAGLLLGSAVAGILCGLALARRRLVRRIKSEIGRENVLLVAASRASHGSDGGSPGGMKTGFLMLLKSGLYFHSWLGGKELFVAGPAITYIGVAEESSGKRAPRQTVALKFLNSQGKEDGVFLRLVSPDRWVDAIKTHLIARQG